MNTAKLTARCSQQEHEQIEQFANEHGLSISEVLRLGTLTYISLYNDSSQRKPTLDEYELQIHQHKINNRIYNYINRNCQLTESVRNTIITEMNSHA